MLVIACGSDDGEGTNGADASTTSNGGKDTTSDSGSQSTDGSLEAIDGGSRQPPSGPQDTGPWGGNIAGVVVPGNDPKSFPPCAELKVSGVVGPNGVEFWWTPEKAATQYAIRAKKIDQAWDQKATVIEEKLQAGTTYTFTERETKITYFIELHAAVGTTYLCTAADGVIGLRVP